MRQTRTEMIVETHGQGLYELTKRIARWAGAQELGEGLLSVYVHHTSASLVIQENVDEDVLSDINDFFRRLVPEGAELYRHRSEGLDDMLSHIRSALTAVHLTVPVKGGRVDLGTFQGVFLYEHRARPRARRLTLHLIGE